MVLLAGVWGAGWGASGGKYNAAGVFHYGNLAEKHGVDALISPQFVWSCGVSGGVVLPFEGDGLAASEV